MNWLFLSMISTIVPGKNTPVTFSIRLVVTSGFNPFVSLHPTSNPPESRKFHFARPTKKRPTVFLHIAA